MKLSDKIRIIRKARGLSQESLGEKLSRTSEYGISRQSVSDWENGKTEPKLENIRDLAEVLQVSFDALLDETMDLNDPDILTRVLQNSQVSRRTEVDSSFRYVLYANNLSARSFISCILFGSSVLLTGLCFGLASWLEIGVLGILAFVFASLSIGVLSSAIIEIIRALKGKVRCYMGEINQSHLILKTYQTAENTLVIPINKITKMALGKKQKRGHGEVIITIEGRTRPVTLCDVMESNKLIEIYEKISSYNGDTDCIRIF